MDRPRKTMACPTSLLEGKISLRYLFAGGHFVGMDIKDRQKAIDLTLVQLDKQFGKGAVMRMGDSLTVMGSPRVSEWPAESLTVASISTRATP